MQSCLAPRDAHRRDSQSFPFVRHLESHTERIRGELKELGPHEFLDWPQSQALSGSWRIHCLYSGDPNWLFADQCLSNSKKCPQTSQVLQSIPGLLQAGFSLLEPGTHVYPHQDELSEDCLRCLLPLTNESGSIIRIGDTQLPIVKGKCIVFHGSVEHESANLGTLPRVVLTVDIAAAHIRSSMLGT